MVHVDRILLGKKVQGSSRCFTVVNSSVNNDNKRSEVAFHQQLILANSSLLLS